MRAARRRNATAAGVGPGAAGTFAATLLSVQSGELHKTSHFVSPLNFDARLLRF